MARRNWGKEVADRVECLRQSLEEARAEGYVIGLSGGKDSAVVAALARQATPKVLGILMPCESNSEQDKEHALLVARKFAIETAEVDLTSLYRAAVTSVRAVTPDMKNPMALANIKPRLRMITLYANAQERNRLVLGTGNRSEIYVGYFTKWGDGACDVNPISDLTVREVFELARYLGIPDEIIAKKPSAGLWVGQTDEDEMGITYDAIDDYLLLGSDRVSAEERERIEEMHARTNHKRQLPRACRMPFSFEDQMSHMNQ